MEQKCLEILGFRQRPTDRELKKAYKTLVKKYHPDVTGGETSQKYIEVDTAYKYLTGKITYREAEAILYPNNYEERKNRTNHYNYGNSDDFTEEFYRNFNNYANNYTDSDEYDENGYYRNKYYTFNANWLRWLPLIIFIIFIIFIVLFFKVVSFLFFTPFGLILLSIYLLWKIFFKN